MGAVPPPKEADILYSAIRERSRRTAADDLPDEEIVGEAVDKPPPSATAASSAMPPSYQRSSFNANMDAKPKTASPSNIRQAPPPPAGYGQARAVRPASAAKFSVPGSSNSPMPEPKTVGSRPASRQSPAPPPLPARSGNAIAVAMYTFDGVEEGDLAFVEGQEIEVLKRTSDPNTWWRGRLVGSSKEGNFPGNYVQLR